jgi:3-carboxy-cis,cis-muconate cycloisomerase
VTRVGDALVEVLDALGVVAADVLVLGRPEIGEVREAPGPGRGGSSTMPHKQNPVLATLVHAAALQAPQLGAQLHLCAGLAVDERPPGAWHAEWPTLRRLLHLSMVATAQAAELVAGLQVDTEAMARRARAAADQLLAERGNGGTGDPGAYLGVSNTFVDAAVARLRGSRRDA